MRSSSETITRPPMFAPFLAAPMLLLAACKGAPVDNGAPTACNDPIAHEQVYQQAAELILRNNVREEVQGLTVLAMLAGEDGATTADTMVAFLKDHVELNDVTGSVDGAVTTCTVTLTALGQSLKTADGVEHEGLTLETKGVQFTVSPDASGAATVLLKRTSILKNEQLVNGVPMSKWMTENKAAPEPAKLDVPEDGPAQDETTVPEGGDENAPKDNSELQPAEQEAPQP